MNLGEILKDGFKVKTENEITVDNSTIVKVIAAFVLIVSLFFIIKNIAN